MMDNAEQHQQEQVAQQGEFGREKRGTMPPPPPPPSDGIEAQRTATARSRIDHSDSNRHSTDGKATFCIRQGDALDVEHVPLPIPSLTDLGRQMGLSDMQCSILAEHERLVDHAVMAKTSEVQSLRQLYRQEQVHASTALSKANSLSLMLSELSVFTENMKRKFDENFAALLLERQRNSSYGQQLSALQVELSASMKRAEKSRDLATEVKAQNEKLRTECKRLEEVDSDNILLREQIGDLEKVIRRLEREDAAQRKENKALREELLTEAAGRKEESKRSEEKLIDLTRLLAEEREKTRRREEDIADLQQQMTLLADAKGFTRRRIPLS